MDNLIQSACLTTVHTLNGTIETVHARAMEPEETVTVYGESCHGVGTTVVEARAVRNRQLGRAYRALGTQTVYSHDMGVWVSFSADGVDELVGPLCVPESVIALANS